MCVPQNTIVNVALANWGPLQGRNYRGTREENEESEGACRINPQQATWRG